MPGFVFLTPPRSNTDPSPLITLEALPPATGQVGIGLEYLAEGAANIVYRFISNEEGGCSPIAQAERLQSSTSNGERCYFGLPPSGAFRHDSGYTCARPPHGKLFRIQKFVTSTCLPARLLIDYHSKVISTLFPEDNLLTPEIIKVGPGVVRALNEALRHDEEVGGRDVPRQHHYISETVGFGLLIADMTTDILEGVTVHFKPKWLLQSPHAPKLAIRCRTCALRAFTGVGRQMCKMAKETPYCPLTLVNGNRQELIPTVKAIMSKQDFYHSLTGEQNARISERLTSYLLGDGLQLLRKLATYQAKYDPSGVLCEKFRNGTSKEFLTAMTLRDCTLYIRFLWDESQPVEARFGDLDPKLPTSVKVHYWRSIEKTLLDQGWYMGKEEEKVPERTCSRTLTFPRVPYWW